MSLHRTNVLRILGSTLCCTPFILMAPFAVAADIKTDSHPKAAASKPSVAKATELHGSPGSSGNTRAGVGSGKNTSGKQTGSNGSGQDGGHRGNVNLGNGTGGDNPNSTGSNSHVKGPGGQDGGHSSSGKFGNGTGGDNPNATNGNHGSAKAPSSLLGNQGTNTGSRTGRGGDDPRENGADKSTQVLHNGQRGGATDPKRAGLAGSKGQKADFGDGWFGGNKPAPAPAPGPDAGPKPQIDGATPIPKPAPPPKDPGPGGGAQKLKPYVPPKSLTGSAETHN